MADLRTEVTEIITGLGMIQGYKPLPAVMGQTLSAVSNVSDQVWERLREAYAAGVLAGEFEAAWENGRFFFEASDGLRGRIPMSVTWKGPQRAVGYELVPADLRIDHVYLVSCKYLSKVLHNVAPTYVFDRLLAHRGPGVADWYADTALEAYQEFYAAVRAACGLGAFPQHVQALTAAHRNQLRLAVPKKLEGDALDTYKVLCLTVAEASAKRWQAALGSTIRAKEEMLWRLLRLSSASYFVLGSSKSGPMRLRIATPWDWRQSFTMNDLDVHAVSAGQPLVGWRATVHDRTADSPAVVEGQVEVRWSHRKFSSVEAKVLLTTPHESVPGYFPLA